MNDSLFNLTAYQLMSRDVLMVPEQHVAAPRGPAALGRPHLRRAGRR